MYLLHKLYLKLHQKSSLKTNFERHGEHNLAERGERVSGTDMQRSFGDGAQAIGNARESWGN